MGLARAHLCWVSAKFAASPCRRAGWGLHHPQPRLGARRGSGSQQPGSPLQRALLERGWRVSRVVSAPDSLRSQLCVCLCLLFIIAVEAWPSRLGAGGVERSVPQLVLPFSAARRSELLSPSPFHENVAQGELIFFMCCFFGFTTLLQRFLRVKCMGCPMWGLGWGGRTLKPKKDHQKKTPNKTPLIKVLGFGSSFLCGSRPVKLISFLLLF